MTSPQLILTASLTMAALATSLASQEQSPTETLAHTRTEFHFTADAPMEQAAPLFGANEERKWAPEWKPAFVYPNPAQDQQGMVFQVAHGAYTSTWVNTALDLAGGHIQYAYVIPGAMATTIDIRLASEGAQKTAVSVVYERTALAPEANEHVRHFASNDAKSGPEWEAQINGYLAKQAGRK